MQDIVHLGRETYATSKAISRKRLSGDSKQTRRMFRSSNSNFNECYGGNCAYSEAYLHMVNSITALVVLKMSTIWASGCDDGVFSTEKCGRANDQAGMWETCSNAQ